jgi:hypothetical protein
VEELIDDVRENGSATRRDAALGDENEKTREELTKVHNGGAFGKFGEEFGGEVGRVVGKRRENSDGLHTEVARTKT